MSDPTVSKIILQQLGGNRFMAMTGAKNLVYDDKSLTMKLPSNITKGRITHFKVALSADDTYRLTTIRVRGTNSVEVETLGGVYAEDLQRIFTGMTGLATRL